MPLSPLDEIAAALCTVPPASFTRERAARVAAASDAALAAAVRRLRKPSTAAWAVNLLVDRRPADLAGALELADALREAQDDLDAETMTALTRQRRSLVAGLAREAARIAAEEGVALSAAAVADVEQTLNAAMRDEVAADAVMTGRLLRPLEAVGFDPVDLDGAVAGEVTTRAARAPRDDLAQRRARKAAERDAREADRAAGDAQRELTRADAALDRARRRADLLHERADELRAELAEVVAQLEGADAATRDAEAHRSEAAAAARTAAHRADAAHAALEDRA